MKTKALISAILLLAISVALAETSDPIRAKLRIQIVTEMSSKSRTTLFALEEGAETVFGDEYPKLKVLVLPLSSSSIPIQVSFEAEDGQTINSMIVYYTPGSPTEFTLAADGIDAKGRISGLMD